MNKAFPEFVNDNEPLTPEAGDKPHCQRKLRPDPAERDCAIAGETPRKGTESLRRK